MPRYRSITASALLGLLAWSSPAATQESEPYPWHIQELADGVYAALQPSATRFDESNSLVIIGDSEVVVVDAQANPRAVEGLIKWIAGITPAPVRLVINTHWHGDHTQGNAIYRDVFGDELQIIGQATLVQDVPERAATFVSERIEYFDAELPGARERLERGVFRDGSAMSDEERAQQYAVLERADAWLAMNRGARFLPPDTVYDQSLDIERAGHRIQLRHFRAHTRGDTLVWLPETRVLASGDLLDDLPYVGHGYPASWLAALDKVRELPVAAAVPGHGPVFRDGAKLDAVQGFLGALVQQAGTAARGGQDLDATMESLDLTSWRDLLVSDEVAAEFWSQVYAEAVERAWLEARGELR